MRRIALVLFILMFAGSFCFAQEPAKPATPATPATPAVPKSQVEAKTFVGKVESISLADAAKGTKSEIVVIDEAGKKIDFVVKATATIYDATSSAITLDKIKKDEKVKIKYKTTKEGVELAMSIHVMP